MCSTVYWNSSCDPRCMPDKRDGVRKWGTYKNIVLWEAAHLHNAGYQANILIPRNKWYIVQLYYTPSLLFASLPHTSIWKHYALQEIKSTSAYHYCEKTISILQECIVLHQEKRFVITRKPSLHHYNNIIALIFAILTLFPLIVSSKLEHFYCMLGLNDNILMPLSSVNGIVLAIYSQLHKYLVIKNVIVILAVHYSIWKLNMLNMLNMQVWFISFYKEVDLSVSKSAIKHRKRVFCNGKKNYIHSPHLLKLEVCTLSWSSL